MTNTRLIPNFFSNTLTGATDPLSAGTFVSEICVVCTDPDTNITTATYATNTPHPVWTNEMGKAVVQTQMVTIGGPDGLNS
jgi:hypothetical protein